MLNKTEEPQPNQAIACVQAVQCECGWETVVLMPEESHLLIVQMFSHLKDRHGLELPLFTVTVY